MCFHNYTEYTLCTLIHHLIEKSIALIGNEFRSLHICILWLCLRIDCTAEVPLCKRDFVPPGECPACLPETARKSRKRRKCDVWDSCCASRVTGKGRVKKIFFELFFHLSVFVTVVLYVVLNAY